MSGDSFLRRSLRRSKKKKEEKTEKEPTRQSTSNFALALGETGRLSSENQRLRQKLEFERARNNYQGNDFKFPNKSTSVSAGQQTDDLDVVYSRKSTLDLENENIDLKRKLQELQLQLEQNNTLKSLETKITYLQQQLFSTCDPKEKALLKEIKKLETQIEILQKQVQDLAKSSTLKVHRRARTVTQEGKEPEGVSNTGLEEIRDLMVRCSDEAIQRMELLEDTLAKEIKNNCTLQKANDKEEIPDTPQVLKMPTDIKHFAWKLQAHMVTMNKVKHLSRALGVDPVEVERLSCKDRATPRDVFWSALCTWCRQNVNVATVDRLHQAACQVNIDILKNGLMPETDRQVLEKYYSYLEDNLLPIVTLPYLRDNGLLDNSDVFHVTSQSTRRERCASLLNLLPLFGEQAFDLFCEALVKSRQSHLAEELEEKWKRLTGSNQGDAEETETLRKQLGTPTQAYGDWTLPKLRSGLRQPEDEILFKTLATLLARTSHMEAIMMNLSPDSNYSSLARSEMESTL